MRAIDNAVGIHLEKAAFAPNLDPIAFVRFRRPDYFEILPARLSGGRVLHLRGLQGGTE